MRVIVLTLMPTLVLSVSNFFQSNIWKMHSWRVFFHSCDHKWDLSLWHLVAVGFSYFTKCFFITILSRLPTRCFSFFVDLHGFSTYALTHGIFPFVWGRKCAWTLWWKCCEVRLPPGGLLRRGVAPSGVGGALCLLSKMVLTKRTDWDWGAAGSTFGRDGTLDPDAMRQGLDGAALPGVSCPLVLRRATSASFRNLFSNS